MEQVPCKVELNQVCFDIIRTALTLYNTYFLNDYKKDPEYLAICANCGFSGHEDKIILAIIAEMEQQIDGRAEEFTIILLLPQWQLVTRILTDFYLSLRTSEEELLLDKAIISKTDSKIELNIEQDDLDNYLGSMEVILEELNELIEIEDQAIIALPN